MQSFHAHNFNTFSALPVIEFDPNAIARQQNTQVGSRRPTLLYTRTELHVATLKYYLYLQRISDILTSLSFVTAT
jgi:hypothetical protein